MRIKVKISFIFFLLAGIAAIQAVSEPVQPYDRGLFGSWSDEDKDCQNTRHELLQDLSTGSIDLSENRCRVVRGRWLDPYTDQIITESQLLDIDHLVPLKYSWERGAHNWSPTKRRQFANDPINLFAVEKSVNRQKSSSGPSKWLPPNAQFRCEYILRFQRVVKLYKLQQSRGELLEIHKLLKKYCV